MKRCAVCFALACALAGALAGPARALTPTELQALLKSAPAARELAFDEVRESPWLGTPLTSRGTLHAGGQQLEKRITHPRVETWRLLPDRIEWVGTDASQVREIRLADAPALAALADTLRHVVAGDLLALERDFRLELSGDALAWTLRLQPLPTSAARPIDYLELQGARGRLQQIVLVERQGERTTTRITP